MVLMLTIPSYIYSQYADDDNIRAFVDAYNTLAQTYLNTVNTLALPIYPGLSGPLLDWVGQGLYGYARPVLPLGKTRVIGPFNTAQFNTIPLNVSKKLDTATLFVTTDDIYIRCLNWHFFKGDGKQFSIPWLKRRVARFVYGPGYDPPGTAFPGWDFDPATQYRISVTFGANNEVNINFLSGLTVITGGAVIGGYSFNSKKNAVYNSVNSIYTPQQVPPLAPVFAAAVASGALEMPFQYAFTVNY